MVLFKRINDIFLRTCMCMAKHEFLQSTACFSSVSVFQTTVQSLPLLFVSFLQPLLLLIWFHRSSPRRSWLHDLVVLAASVTDRFGLGEAAAVEQLIEESQSGEGENGQDEEQEDDEAGDVPAVMERKNLLHQSSSITGNTHSVLKRGRGRDRWVKGYRGRRMEG